MLFLLFSFRLKLLKRIIKMVVKTCLWVYHFEGKEIREDIDTYDKLAEQKPLTHLEFTTKKELLASYCNITLNEEVYWRQKFRIQSLSEGYLNTSFFFIKLLALP